MQKIQSKENLYETVDGKEEREKGKWFPSL
jgi:hypothetical protein